jgi:hypothetical protein
MGFPMLCPDPSVEPYMSGLLYATDEYVYPSFTVNYCNRTDPLKNCVPLDDLIKVNSLNLWF